MLKVIYTVCKETTNTVSKIIIIINLLSIAEFNTNSILTTLYIVRVHTNAIYAHMHIHETFIFMKHTQIHVYTYMDTLTHVLG